MHFVVPETANEFLKGIDSTKYARDTISGLLDLIFASACLGAHTERGSVSPTVWNPTQMGFFLNAAVQLVITHPVWNGIVEGFLKDNIFTDKFEAAEVSVNIMAEELENICNEKMSANCTVEAQIGDTYGEDDKYFDLSMTIRLGE